MFKEGDVSSQYNPSSVHRKPINYATFNWTVVSNRREQELVIPAQAFVVVSSCKNY